MIDLIKAATLSQNNQQRKLAQQTLVQTRQQKTQEFFIALSQLFASNELPGNIRNSVGILLSSSVLTKQIQGFLYDKLSPGAKQTLKDSILTVLLDPSRDLRRAAANTVAAICCIQIPKNEWKAIIPNLAQNLKNQSLEVRQVSILTLGFICERLKSRGDYNFDPSTQEIILSGIIMGIKQQSVNIKQIALKAFRDSIFSMTAIFQNEQYRTFVVNNIVEAINNKVSINLGLQILIQFAKHNYNYLGEYINGFFKILEPIMRNTNVQNQCILAMQFWQTIATECQNNLETNQSTTKYLQGDLLTNIVVILLQNICIIAQDENDDNQIKESAGKTLQSICQCGSQQIYQTVSEFSNKTLSHVDWKYRQASIVAFSIVQVGIANDKRLPIVSSSLLHFLNLLNDHVNRVQLSVIQSLVLLSEICGLSILKHNNFIEILQLIMSKINKSQTYLKHICVILKNLCKQADKNELNVFNGIADDLISVLIKCALTTQSSLEVLNNSILAIMKLIQTAKNEVICLKYINFVLQNYIGLNNLDNEKKNLLEAGLMTIIQICLINLKKSKVDQKLLQSIFNLVIQDFKLKNDVTADGIYVIGALSIFVQNLSFLDTFWPYLEHAIKNYLDAQLFKATISCLSDFIHTFGNYMISKLPMITNLLQLTQKSDMNRQLKLDILLCIGDMFLNCHHEAIPYLNDTMKVIFIFCDAAISLVKVDFNFSEQVKQCLIQAIMSIVHGLNNQKQRCSELLIYFEDIFKFIQFSVNKINRPTVDYIKKCMFLAADIHSFYGKQIDKYTKQQYILVSIDNLKRHDKKGQLKNSISYIMGNI